MLEVKRSLEILTDNVLRYQFNGFTFSYIRIIILYYYIYYIII